MGLRILDLKIYLKGALAAFVTAGCGRKVYSQESYSQEQWALILSSSVLQTHKHCLATAE